MKVLLTGHKGYIGAVMGPFLRDAGHTVVGLDSGLYDGCLFGDKMRRTFADMGILGYEHHDLEAMIEQDEKIAGDLERARIEQVDAAIAHGAASD